MTAADFSASEWRKSTRSSNSTACVEVAVAGWRKSSRSANSTNCVEVGVAGWRKSSRSGYSTDCVEIAAGQRIVGIRDSKDPSGPVIAVPATTWSAFLGWQTT